MIGADLTRALKSRRDALPEFVGRYYELINREAEIQATDKDEYVLCEHMPGGELAGGSVGRRVRAEGGETPTSRGRSVPGRPGRSGSTSEGETTARRYRGPRDGLPCASMAVGDDSFTNSSRAGASRTRFYDYRGENRFIQGGGAKVDESPYKRPPAPVLRARYALDWGMQTIAYPVFVVTPDLGVFVGGAGSRRYFGYRKDPYSSSHSMNAGLAINRRKPFVSYSGTFRRWVRGLDAKVELEYSGIQVIRYNGLGNETRIDHPSSFYEVEQNHFAFAPALEFGAGGHQGGGSHGGMKTPRTELTIALGPVVKYSDTPLASNEGRFIASRDHPVYGTGSFGQAGAQGEVMFDSRDNAGYPTRGALLRLGGAVYPAVWDVESAFGSMDGEARAYLTAPVPANPTLALRAGGRKVWGTFPFQESAFLGGPGLIAGDAPTGSLRGFRKNRFAGDASLYGNSELRLVLGKIRLLVPGELGLFGAADAGRVFHSGDPDDAGTWHTGVGGGLWLSFLQRLQSLSVAAVRGDDLTGVYVRAGLAF